MNLYVINHSYEFVFTTWYPLVSHPPRFLVYLLYLHVDTCSCLPICPLLACYGESYFAQQLQQAASSSHSHDSDQNLLFDMLTLSRFIRPCISKYAQTTQDKVDYHVYPSETCIIKAFTANDFVFYDKSGHVLKKIDN
jgi:hypothetical protein